MSESQKNAAKLINKLKSLLEAELIADKEKNDLPESSMQTLQEKGILTINFNATGT
jgi:hypothetical protein